MKTLIAFLSILPLLVSCSASNLGAILLAGDQYDNAGPARQALIEYLPAERIDDLNQELLYFDWALSLFDDDGHLEKRALDFPTAFDQLCPNIESTALVVNAHEAESNLPIPNEIDQFSDGMKPICKQYSQAKTENERIKLALNAFEMIKMVAAIL